jgi:outer membrane protein OmpA-like peptidoglycan-associated protein
MKTNKLLILVACAGFIGGCATVPKELTDARQAYQRASEGPAAKVAPAELHVANQALAKAEQSFKDNSDSYRTRDLAYVAERKAQLAEATASITMEQKNQSQANNEYQTAQGRIIANTKQDLSRKNAALAESQRTGKMTAEQLAAEKKARADAEERAAEALAALAKLAEVKEEPRGTVITLSGSVLFASAQSTLLPQARSRLDQVAEVLLTTRDRNLIVEGHTDSQGSDSYNMNLSQDRADSVRRYLVQRGYQGSLIQAHGLGEGQPIANNDNAEGRANNRRVEIIIERGPNTSEQYSSNR